MKKNLDISKIEVQSFITANKYKGGISAGLTDCGGFTCYEYCTDDPDGSTVYTVWVDGDNICGPIQY